MKVCLVLLYGLYNNENRTEEKIYGYDIYLKRVAGHLFAGFYDKVVLCGGRTNPEKPDISEAETVYNVILEKSELPESDFVLEKDSLHTTQNIYNGWSVFLESKKPKRKIDCTIVSDHKHKLKSQTIAFHMKRRKKFKKLINSLNFVSFDRPDNHPKNTWWFQTAQAIGYLVWPPFITKHLAIKKKRLLVISKRRSIYLKYYAVAKGRITGMM